MSTLAAIYERADLYDAIYRGRGKDYAVDTDAVVDLIRDRVPEASSLLDVACGTGGHLIHLTCRFDHVEGVDLAPDMLRVAAARCPDVPLHEGDMRDFALGRTFDAVTCLFSSIGYLPTVADLEACLRTLATHVAPGGVVVVEPWWTPSEALSGHVVRDLAEVDGRTYARISHAVADASAHHMNVHYVIASPAEGIEHFTDDHVLSLFEREQYETAFRAAGLSVEYLRSSPRSPGMFVGQRPGGR